MLTAIVGINWGDEGKGRMVDLLSDRYDIIARYQGGNNAGHTVINEKGKFILNLLPSGILRDETVNVMGNGMVIDIEHLYNEIKRLRDAGNTVIVIEHNLDVIKVADYIVDLGPEGGDGGGTIIANGTPEEVAKVKESYTGQFLDKILNGGNN